MFFLQLFLLCSIESVLGPDKVHGHKLYLFGFFNSTAPDLPLNTINCRHVVMIVINVHLEMTHVICKGEHGFASLLISIVIINLNIKVQLMAYSNQLSLVNVLSHTLESSK